jgi:hypothetical protein
MVQNVFVRILLGATVCVATEKESTLFFGSKQVIRQLKNCKKIIYHLIYHLIIIYHRKDYLSSYNFRSMEYHHAFIFELGLNMAVGH